MRFRLLSAVAVLSLACLVSCGMPGAPQPPALELPRRVRDLKVTRKADKVSLTWTTPSENTDHSRLKHLGASRVCRGVDVVAMSQCGETIGSLPPAQTPAAAAAAFSDLLPKAFQQSHATGFASYGVEVQNRHGRSAGLSNQVVVPLAPTLPAPGDVKAQVTADGVQLTWHDQDRDSRLRYFYRVYRREPSAQKAIIAGEVPATPETKLLDRGVEWEKTYLYTVTAVTVEAVQGSDEQIEGEDSGAIQVFVHDVFPPAVPGGLQAVSSGLPQQPYIDLSWAPDTESDLAGYNVYRHEEGTAPVKINRELVKTPTYRDSEVQAGHRYFYSITAVDAHGNESGHSAEASETVAQ